MTDATALVTEIDDLRQRVAELEALVARLTGEPTEPGGSDANDPRPDEPEDLIEPWRAERRFGYPADTIRSWARTHPHLGGKRGGRWLVSASRLRAFVSERTR